MHFYAVVELIPAIITKKPFVVSKKRTGEKYTSISNLWLSNLSGDLKFEYWTENLLNNWA